MDGFLLVDKPAGVSSFGVVAKVRSVIRGSTGQKIKIGHCGTLDPAATGLMVLVIGKYTKRAGEYSKLDKTYEAELTLGAVSTTGDSEGEITPVSDIRPTKNQIENAIAHFIGNYKQTPPAYSAVKVGGQRAYKLARAGKKVEIKPREVSIYQIAGVQYAYPKLKFSVSVGSGTYIRSLATDLGEKLGEGAYLSALRRTRIGPYAVEEALGLGDLTINTISDKIKR